MAASWTWYFDPMGRVPLSMLNTFPAALLIAIILGFLAGIGVGGGSLLILYLTLVLDMPHADARMFNLLFFLPCAITASIFRWKQGALPIKKILPAIIAGMISAAVFSMISQHLNVEILKKCFGVLLLVTGLRELTFKQKK